MENDNDALQTPLPEGMMRLPNNKVRFQKGNDLGGRRKGVLNKNTLLKHELSIQNWNDLKGFIEGEGISRFIDQMEALDGKDYIIAYLGILPYVKPKIANIEVREDNDKPKFDKNHTITIRDMTKGTSVDVII